MEPNAAPIVRVQNIEKSFGHVRALRGVSLDVRTGEVLAIVGDNGAGKTTLIKILAGVHAPDGGEIHFNGSRCHRLTPKAAIVLGISTVFQDLSLVECRDVTSNIFLGREERWGPFIRKRVMDAMARRLLEGLKIDIPFLNIPVGLLSGGQRQAVAVARAIRQGGRLIIMDEPTAAMGLKESATVLALIERLRSQGFAVVLISHNLHNVFAVADRICVMRHGRIIGLLQRRNTCPEEVVGMITGADGGGEAWDD